MQTSKHYFKAQLAGWSIYILISTVVLIMSGKAITMDVVGGIYLVFALGIVISHVYRYIIIRLKWLEKDIFSLIPRVAIASIVLSLIFHLAYITLGNLTFDWGLSYSFGDTNLVTWGMLFFIWNLFYFTYIFFQRFRKEEIKNFQLEAARNEYELRRLRDQMNPHFIFNAMNTIRALIDENPAKAKNAVTQLSNVLRSSLQAGEDELISLEKEIQITKDYLEIEKARYEERLSVNWIINTDLKKPKIPPLLLQTIIENCIKHGIAKLPDGGTIDIEVVDAADAVDIHVFNSGQYDAHDSDESSMGLENTKNRLRLSFENKGWMTIGNHGNDKVKTTVHLPLKKE
ncbi:MAG: histidine kinase [Salibacteraceae bacterium]